MGHQTLHNPPTTDNHQYSNADEYWTRPRKAEVFKAPYISYKEGVTGSSPVAPTTEVRNPTS